MNMFAIFTFLVFGLFAFLGGYTLSLWLPAANFSAQETYFPISSFATSWNTTIGAKIESISKSKLTLLKDSGETLVLQLDEAVQVRRIIQTEEGEVKIEDIPLENLQKGDNVIVNAVFGEDNTIRTTGIDKIVNITP